MSDLIKREDAIEAVHNYWKKRLDTLPTADIQQTDKILEHNKTLCNFINAIPSADRPQGEWIWSPRDTDGTVSGCCSNCSFSHLFIGGHTAQYNYCPNCGAKMKGADGKERVDGKAKKM